MCNERGGGRPGGGGGGGGESTSAGGGGGAAEPVAFDNLKESVTYAKSLGVTIDAERGDLELVNGMNQWIYSRKQAGATLPDRIEIHPKSGFITEHATAAADVKRGSILINRDHPRWKSTNYDSTLNHETGHLQHYKNNKMKYDMLQHPTIGKHSNDGLKTAAKVSNYAKTNKVEFVAEVYSGMSSGKTYSKDVMSYYKQLNGPSI